MQIRVGIIDGFGIFANVRITGLTSGVNVIYGSNEFGKTTILDFIRRILFGFPRSSPSTNPYPSLNGGAYGGKLICELDSGETITIHRTEGPRGGRVTIQKGSVELSAQEELNDLLGHITGTFFENVYAISLDELQAVKSLDKEEVKSRIYGAGLGLGGISLSKIKNELKTQCETLFRPRGSSQKMASLYSEVRKLEQDIREIQTALSSYDNLVAQRDELTEEIGLFDVRITKLEATKRSLENKQKLYSIYIDLIEAQSELSLLDELNDFPGNAIENLDKLKNELGGLDKRIDEDIEELRTLEAISDSLTYNKELIDLESTVISLQRLSEMYRSAVRDIDKVKEERKSLYDNTQTEMKKLGQGWTEDRIREFNLSYLQKDTIHSFKDRFSEAKRQLESATDKLEFYREQKAAELSKGFTGPEFYRLVIYAITTLGLLGVLGGWFYNQWWLAGFSSLILIIGIIVSLKIRKGGQIDAIIPLEQKFSETLEQAENVFTKLQLEWSEFLKSINFEERLMPEGALGFAEAIKNIQSRLSDLKKYDQRIEDMQETIDEVSALHNRVVTSIDHSKISNDISTNIELIVQQFTEAKDTKKDREINEHRINELTNKIEKLRVDKQLKEEGIQNYISSLEAANEDDLVRKHNVFTERKKLNETINECKKIIRSTVGTDEHYDSFIESLPTTTPEKIELELNEVNSQIEELVNERDQKNQFIGELRNKIEELSSHQDLLVKQSEAELRKQELKELSRDWAKFQIAQVMLDKAIYKYENTRQPEVIRVAEDIFSKLTNKKYPTILKPLYSDELIIRDKFNNSKGVLEMSRGTKEQLYFAMRLGLIKEYESRSESMPVIMDDILVNFDDERGPLSIQALEDFSKGRQVIVFTCHRNMLEIYKKYGANEVVIS